MSEKQSISICQLISRGDRSSHTVLPDELENETWSSVKQIRFYSGRQKPLWTSVFWPRVWKNICLHLFFLKIYLFSFTFVNVCLLMYTPFMPVCPSRLIEGVKFIGWYDCWWEKIDKNQTICWYNQQELLIWYVLCVKHRGCEIIADSLPTHSLDSTLTNKKL